MRTRPMCKTCSAPARKARGFFVPADELAAIQAAPGARTISRRLYADHAGFAAFVSERGAAVVDEIKRVLLEHVHKHAGAFRTWQQIGHVIDGTLTCRRCKETKPRGVFTTAKGRPIPICRRCEAKRDESRRAANLERYRALRRRRYWARVEEFRRRQRERAKTERGREINRKAVERYKRLHPERVSARTIAKRAIARGEVKPAAGCQILGCDCRDGLHVHHVDYARPLDVLFLCREHHEHLHHQGRLRLKHRVGRYLYASAPPETFRPRPPLPIAA